MSAIVLEAQKRTPGGKNVNRRLRKSGTIPAVIYGPGKESIAVSVDPGKLKQILFFGQRPQHHLFAQSGRIGGSQRHGEGLPVGSGPG